ncbi:MAG: 4-(cytidine 5'-diphospho)-2-C-methyl-D-erythritol kinase [Candidatus Omnitrophota bacterium]
MNFTAPAKINLYLEVISRKEDGYHEIATLFERISILDFISIEPDAPRTNIVCDNPKIPVQETSLLFRTVKAFTFEYGKDIHFDIHLQKKIPIAAGLGGGSSDAACLLKGMNKVMGQPFDKEKLFDIAQKLGADIPFFLEEYSFAQAEGRGDIVREIKTSLKLWHVLLSPPFELSTKEVYAKVSHFSLTKSRGLDKMTAAFLNKKSVESIAKNCRNDLQTIALQAFPELKAARSELKKVGAKVVLLSGSGPTVFGIFEQREEALSAESRLGQVFSVENGWRVYAAETY